MKLQTLRTHLKTAKTAAIEVVELDYLFDYLTVTNKDKKYPCIIVDIGNESKAVGDIRSDGKSTLETWIYCIGLVEPENDVTPAALTSWDNLETELKAYLLNIQAIGTLPIEVSVKDIQKRYIPGGIISPEREIMVGYRITITMHC